MRGIYIIAKRELYSLLVSPLCYVVLGIFALLFGLLFVSSISNFDAYLQQAEIRAQLQQNPDILAAVNLNERVIFNLIGNTYLLLIFSIPLLSMRFFSEEKLRSTYELLMTSPISTWEIILGKFKAAAVLLLLILSTHFIFLTVMFQYGNPEWGPVLSGYLGLFLAGLSLFAIGIFASSLTKSAIVAMFVTFGINTLMVILPLFAAIAPTNLGRAIEAAAMGMHFEMFSQGVIQVSSLVYFMTLIVLFLGGTNIAVRSFART